jgi:Flp pilus assembly protein TadG
MTKSCHLGRSQRRQHGLAMVEFVVTAPMLLLLLFGTVVFGEFLIDYSTLNDGVRNAARYVAGAASGNTTDGTIITGGAWTTLVSQGQNLAVYGNVNGNVNGTGPLLPGLTVAEITVTPVPADPKTVPSYNEITVTASYPYQSLFGASMPNFFGDTIATNFTLSISTTMVAL